MKTPFYCQYSRKILLAIFAMIFPAFSFAQVPAPAWLNAFGAGGGMYENGSGIRSGSNGGIYFGGRYAGSINLNGASPAAATGATDCFSAELTSGITGTWATKTHTSGGYDYTFGYNIDNNNNTYTVGTVNSGGSFFVTKTNSAGVTQWAISPGNSAGANGVCVDAAGNVYVVGGYSATMNLGLGNLTYSGGNSDIFLVKYNGAGVIQWSVGYGGTGYDAARACELDPNGNIVVVGGYTGAPAYGAFTLPAAGAYSNLFIARFNAANGSVMNVYTATNAGIVNGGWYEENDLRVDSCGNIYAAGHFEGTANFGTLSVTSAGSDDVFLAKLNPSGQFQWVVRGGGAGADQADGVALDKNWDVVISGHFAGTATFGSTSITAVGNNDMFVAKYASGNGALMYVQKGGGPGFEDSYGGCTVDNNRQVYVTGGYSDNNVAANTTNFGPFNLGNGYYGNIYVAKLDSTPNLRIIPQAQSSYCAGACYSLPFTTIGTFNGGNVFTAELSDPNGNFASGTTVLGTYTGTSSGTINICIPALITTSSNYLLRIYSSSPSYCSIVKCSTISISTPPTVSVTGPSSICSGGNVTLTASGATTYAWTPTTFLSPTTGPTVTSTPTATITYSVIGTNAAGCTDTATTTLTVSAASNPTITGVTSICAGSSTTLTSSGSGTFSWSSGGTSASETVSPAVTTNYTVTVTDISGCTGTATTTVTVNPVPVVSISGNTTICSGSSTTLTATGGGTYSWSSGGTTASETISPSTTTTYTVTVTDPGGCSNNATSTVTVNPLPVPTISGNTSICAGSSTTLTASGGGTYSWSSGGTNASENLSPASTSTYTVTVTDPNGCVGTASATVTVNPLPSPSISGNTTICTGSSTTLTASGGNSYSWSSGGNAASETVSPASTSNYTVTVTNANGCVNTQSVTVTVNPLPVVNISGNTTVCAGSSTTLTASGGGTYSWSSGGTNAAETITPASTTTYTVTIINANGCSANASSTVTVNPIPVSTITGTSSICNGQTATLSTSGTGNYIWSNSATSSTISVSPSTTTTYSLTVTDPSSGCSSSSTFTVSVLSQPVASVSGNSTICSGDQTTLNASGGTLYTWSTAQTSASISVSPSSTSTYSVIVSNGACADTASITITVNPLPVVNVGPDQTITWGTSATLSANSTPGTTFSWAPSNGLSCTNCANPVASPSVTTTYCVLATNSNGCSDTSCITIFVDITCGQVFIPNAFSPNGDGQNDVLMVDGNCITTMTFQIFDRWGEKVFESDDKSIGWDGNYKGEAAETGVYVYQLNATLITGDVIVKKGDVAIMR